MTTGKLIDNLKMYQKFGLIVILFLITVSVPLKLLLEHKNADIEFVTKEIAGVDYIRTLQTLLKSIPEHQALISQYADNASPQAKDFIRARQLSIDDSFKNLEAMDQKYRSFFNASDKIGELKNIWQETKYGFLTLKPAESNEIHSKIAAKTKDIISYIGGASNLLLDPEFDAYCLMDSFLAKIPQSEELIAKAADLGSAVAKKRALSNEDRVQLVIWITTLKTTISALESSLKTAVAKNASGRLKQVIEMPASDAVKAALDLAAAIDKKILSETTASVSLEEISAAGQKALEFQFRLRTLASTELDGILGSRAAEFIAKKKSVITFVALILIFVLLLVYAILTRISSRIGELSNAAGLIAQGDITALNGTEAKDELGELFRNIKGVAETIKDNAAVIEKISDGDVSIEIAPRSENDICSKNLMKMCGLMKKMAAEIKEISDSAEKGDLSRRANVEEYNGTYREICSGANKVMDAFDASVKKAAETEDSLHGSVMSMALNMGDYFELLRSLSNGNFEVTANEKSGDEMFDQLAVVTNKTVGMIKSWTLELEKIIAGIREGDLRARGNSEAFDGDWKRLVQGLNDLIEAFTGPLHLTTDYLKQISVGNIPELITSEYKGGFNEIKNSLNTCIVTINQLIIKDGGSVLQAAAEKDLAVRMSGDYQGVFKTMKDNINTLIENLDEALQQVAQSADDTTALTLEINEGSQVLANNSAEQASSLEEVSSSLHEMNSMAKQNAGNAKEGQHLAVSARESAGKGVDSMKRLSCAVGQIKDSSNKTAKIIKTIDEIAFQTNLLALNAAVEAARAGDAGRGFAVVAEEVRNLAMRSAEAAKNTARMIEDSVKDSDNVVVINNEVTKNLEEINQQINKVNVFMEEIAAASEQQSQGVEQINVAVAQMNQVTQQNATHSEQFSHSAEQLSKLTVNLNKMVLGFNLNLGGGNEAPKNHKAEKLHIERLHIDKLSAFKADKTNADAGKNKNTPKKPAGRTTHDDPKKLIPFDDDEAVLREF